MAVGRIHHQGLRTAVCAGYFDGDLLFDVGGFLTEAFPVPSYVAATFSILTRGAPTRPSPELQRRFGFDWKEVTEDPLVLVSNHRPDWSQTIKGADDGFNPALEFFEEALPYALGEWAFIQNLLVPEYPLFRELGVSSALLEGSNNELVDFYLPQADLVIEIDGGQHEDPRQIGKDRSRDYFLSRHGIQTLRLKTSDLRTKGHGFDTFISSLRQRCEQSPRLAPYRTFSASRKADAASLRYDLTAAIRLQIAIILAIAHRKLDPTDAEWTIAVNEDFHRDPGRDWVRTAVDELFYWFDLFARISHSVFIRPKVKRREDGLLFDVALFSRSDDLTPSLPGITVRTCAVQDQPVPKLPRLRHFGLSSLDTEAPSECTALPDPEDLAELNRRIFGHDDFRPGQEALILNAISGQNSLGLMPTGGGKSLCFQIPALLGAGTTIVVVPIKALGRDHAAELSLAGFSGRVVNIDSDMLPEVREIFGRRLLRGEMRFAFVSPERFQSDDFREKVRRLNERGSLRMFVIDEIHCMSEWGHDFRPSYLTLPGALRNLAPNVPIMGLTATASVNVLRDIQNEFAIPDELVAYEMHRSRSELNFSVRKARSGPLDIQREVANILDHSGGNERPPIHVFARYVNGTGGVEAIASALADPRLGERVGYFSGAAPKKFHPKNAAIWLRDQGIPFPRNYEEYKQTVQNLWKNGQLDVIVTTKAFGMGINKPDVRHTIHAGMPSSMEAFYQEAGRAGRDREPAYCHMLFVPETDDARALFLELEKDMSPEAMKTMLAETRDWTHGDFRKQLWFLNQNNISLDDERKLVTRLHKLVAGSSTATLVIRRRQIGEEPWIGQRFQLSLFRLYQMGLIDPWTVVDWGRQNGENSEIQAVEVLRRDQTFPGACASVLARMRAVSGQAAATEQMTELEALSKSDPDWPALYTILLSWVRRTQQRSRLQSTWNLYEKCMAFREAEAEEFRDQLEAFFKIDSNAFQLAALRDMPLTDAAEAIRSLLIMPDGVSLKEKAALLRLSAQLARLMEGTRDSPGLNLAAASLRLLTEVDPSPEVEERLYMAVKGNPFEFWRMDGRKLLTMVAASSEIARDRIGAFLVLGASGRQDLLDLHGEIPAKSVEAALFGMLSRELAEAV